MPKVVSAITATIEVIGKLKEGDYGPYRPVLFLDHAQTPGSEAAKIWKSLSEEETAPLRKGMKVQLVPAGVGKNGKEKHSIVLLEEGSAPASAAPSRQPASTSLVALPVQATRPIPQRPASVPPTWNPQDKQKLSARVCDLADLFKFTLETVQHKFDGMVDARDCRTIATTLFLRVVETIPASEPELEAVPIIESDIPY